MSPVARLLLACLFAFAAAACDEEPAVFGPASPSSSVTCLGVPQPKCDELARQALTELRVPAYRTIVVRCVEVRCSERSGKATIDIVDADGNSTGIGRGWDTLGPIGVPAPEPSG